MWYEPRVKFKRSRYKDGKADKKNCICYTAAVAHVYGVEKN